MGHVTEGHPENVATADAVRTEGVVKTFGSGDDEVRALAGVDLRIDTGSVFGLLGANGSGKSTLIRILTTLTRPTAGRAWVNGHDVATHPAEVRRSIGVTGQQVSLDDRLSGAENLRILGRLHGLGRAQSRRTADEILERYALSRAADRPVRTYSGGMRRRLDIVVGLIRRPTLLFLDEPTTGLDPRSRAEIWETIRDLAKAGTSVFLTTQYLDEADRLADRIAVLARGQVIADGTPHGLKARIGRHLSVTLANPRDRDRACHALAALGVSGLNANDARRLGPPRSNATAADGLDSFTAEYHALADATTITGHIDAHIGPLPLPDLLGALTCAGIEVADIGMLEPTLDEVYLALTEEEK
ncbi:ATP-binding cassette domain-containing protein [Tomitella gaofuii]|uniref:ATP-binding cassette domain-containing protein n=1 Tax=Tomitella gaofuii TaxID=2760083 RepID=UPI0015FBC4F8|nr:ATP-binding cassette domain-containing protein [Tomitella gaofuii]